LGSFLTFDSVYRIDLSYISSLLIAYAYRVYGVRLWSVVYE